MDKDKLRPVDVRDTAGNVIFSGWFHAWGGLSGQSNQCYAIVEGQNGHIRPFFGYEYHLCFTDRKGGDVK